MRPPLEVDPARAFWPVTKMAGKAGAVVSPVKIAA